MICDLSIEALFRFCRLTKRKSLAAINIVGISAEHLESFVSKGWLIKSSNTTGPSRSDHSPLYQITDAGITAARKITTFVETTLLP
jgi:hypothetical protein